MFWRRSSGKRSSWKTCVCMPDSMLCVPCVQDTRMSRVTHRLTKQFCGDHLMNSFKKKEDETFGIRALISTILPTHVYPKCIAPTERTMLSWTDFGSWMAKSGHKVFIWDFGFATCARKRRRRTDWPLARGVGNVPFQHSQKMATGVEGWRQTLFTVWVMGREMPWTCGVCP